MTYRVFEVSDQNCRELVAYNNAYQAIDFMTSMERGNPSRAATLRLVEPGSGRLLSLSDGTRDVGSAVSARKSVRQIATVVVATAFAAATLLAPGEAFGEAVPETLSKEAVERPVPGAGCALPMYECGPPSEVGSVRLFDTPVERQSGQADRELRFSWWAFIFLPGYSPPLLPQDDEWRPSLR